MTTTNVGQEVVHTGVVRHVPAIRIGIIAGSRVDVGDGQLSITVLLQLPGSPPQFGGTLGIELGGLGQGGGTVSKPPCCGVTHNTQEGTKHAQQCNIHTQVTADMACCT